MKFKMILIIVVALALLYIGYYLISPLFIVEEADESSPLDNLSASGDGQVVDDVLLNMDNETRKDFEDQVQGMSNQTTIVEENMPLSPVIIAQGDFVANAHDVEGKALLIDSNGQKILRFENFETVNGPNLHVYLSTDLSEDDYVDLGELKATKGNFNYVIDPSIDTGKYNHVLVWCVPFRILFSYAILT